MPSVRRALSADSRAIARVHREVISWGLLAHLGEGAVTAFYRGITQSTVAFCFVAEEQGQLIGFAAGVCDWSRLRRQLTRAMWWSLLCAIPSLLRSGKWRRLFETGGYTQSRHEGVNAEFLSLGVHPCAQGRLWTGAALARAVLDEFRRRGVQRIRGVVWERNERALKFFEAMGFRFVSDVEIHPGETSRTFVRDLLPGGNGD
jgi:ribosomal protein S18 acetylase RimI-like enzyme